MKAMATTQRRTRQNLTTGRKTRIRERANWHCERCGQDCKSDRLGRHALEVHHRQRVADGGSNSDDNLTAICTDCHRKTHRKNAVISGCRVRILEGVTGLARFDSATRNPALGGNLPRAEHECSQPGQGDTGMARMGGATAQQESEIKEIKERDLEWNTSTGEPHPTGLYELDLVEIKPFEEDGVQRIRLVFHTEEEQENGEPWPVSCKSKPSFHPRANVSKFLNACGDDPKTLDPKTFKLSDYVHGKPKHKHVMGSIIHEPRQDGQGVYARIESFAPMRKPKPARQEESEQPAPVEEVAEVPREVRKAALLEDDDE